MINAIPLMPSLALIVLALIGIAVQCAFPKLTTLQFGLVGAGVTFAILMAIIVRFAP